MKRILLVGIFLTLISLNAQAASVRVTDGNIFYVGDDGNTKQITTSGRDEYPAIHPDGQWV